MSKSKTLYEELQNAPADRIAEIVSGELWLTPRPASRHSYVASALLSDLHGAFHRGRSGPGGWWILFEPELHLADEVVVPDLAGWQKSRLPEFPDSPWFDLPPDWVCEIVSPSNEHLDRTLKAEVYARHGVEWFWIVDPNRQTLEVLARDGNRWRAVLADRGGAVVSAPPFEALPIELAQLWP